MLRRRPGARDGDERDEDARGATHGSHGSTRDHDCGARRSTRDRPRLLAAAGEGEALEDVEEEEECCRHLFSSHH